MNQDEGKSTGYSMSTNDAHELSPENEGIVPLWGRVKNSDSASESPWSRKLILCLGA